MNIEAIGYGLLLYGALALVLAVAFQIYLRKKFGPHMCSLCGNIGLTQKIKSEYHASGEYQCPSCRSRFYWSMDTGALREIK